jgi:hypothetical protein
MAWNVLLKIWAYKVPFIQNEAVSTIVAGAAGTLLVAGIAFGMARLNDTRKITGSEQVKDSRMKVS